MNKQRVVHKLKRTSAYSFSVTIPKEMVEKYGLKEKQKLNVVDKGRGRIEISDWKKN